MNKNKALKTLYTVGEIIIPLILIGVLIYIVYKILGKIGDVGNSLVGGLGSDLSNASAQTQQQLINLKDRNPLSPQMYNLYGARSSNLLTDSQATSIAQGIYDAKGNWFLSPGADVLPLFNGLFYQIQVSQVAAKFAQMFGLDLMAFLSEYLEGNNTSLFGILGQITGDNERGYKMLLDYVNNLPTGV